MELADELNENLGVSPVQRQAMEIGSLRGMGVFLAQILPNIRKTFSPSMEE